MRYLWFLLLLAAASAASSQPATRPLVLLIHGRGQTERREVAEASWRDALHDGAKAITGDTLFTDADVKFVWYADVLDPQSNVGCVHHENGPFAAQRFYNSKGFQRFWDAARLKLVGMVAVVPKADSMLIGKQMGDVYTYLSNLRKQCGVDGRFIDAVEAATEAQRPLVIVAHSLGSLVAYNVLHDWSSLPQPRVARLVTIGSMLGFPDVYKALFGTMRRPPLPFPATVADWLNVRNGLDVLAMGVAPIIDGPQVGERVRDVLANQPKGIGSAHDALGYLRDPVVASAVAQAWCKSFPTPDSRPVPCSKLP